MADYVNVDKIVLYEAPDTGAHDALVDRAVVQLAAVRARQWVNRTNSEKPTREQLREWFELVLDERQRTSAELANLKRELDTLRTDYAHQERDRAAVLVQRDREHARRGEAEDALAAEMREHRATRGRLERLQAVSAGRSPYVLLRLSAGQAEVVPVSNWEEDADGASVTVEGHRAGGDVR